MRLSLAALALVALAAPSSAQTQYADSAGVYVALHDVSAFGAQGSVGYRASNGFDVGIQYARYSQDFERDGRRTVSEIGTLSSITLFRIGPEVGYTRKLSDRVTGRVSASVLYGSSRVQVSASPTGAGGYNSKGLSSNLTATVARQVPVIGSFQIQPTAGVFVETSRVLERLSTSETSPQSQAAAGLHLALPLSLRVLGQDVTFAPYAQIPLVGPTFYNRTYAGGGLRLNF